MSFNYGQFDNFPYIANVLKYNWEQKPDTFLTTLLTSGVMREDSNIASAIANGSNTFSARYWNELTSAQNDMQVYNGKNDIKMNRVDGGYYSWVVLGRQNGWEALQFTDDFTGTNQINYITSQLNKYRTKERQNLLIKMLTGIFSVDNDDDWKLHTTDISSASNTPTAENELGAATLYQAITKACGDNADGFKVAVMHSSVAMKLNVLKLLEFDKYTDSNGITTDLRTGTMNGIKVIINDNVPKTAAGSTFKYTTYVFGEGMLGYAKAPVSNPIELHRDPIRQGGVDQIMIRFREAMVPYGFTWTGEANNETNTDPKNQTNDVGIPDEQLTKKDNYKRYIDHKAIKLVQIISN